MSPPSLYFIPDADKDDVPDSEPRVVLDGFGNHANAHNLANGFAWGPDGWLYGTHGRTNWSMIGKPGTPEDERDRFDGGVYRYHPVRHVWEPYADGTTNPWGIDWNDFGDAFVCNCVNPHLFHVIPGAHYEPWRGRESSQHAYKRIDTIADHLHFVGIQNVRAALGSDAEDSAGGGHAHCGTMVYLGDNWPAEYRNTVFMNNIHGRRINNDLLERKGSGYSASHGRDIMRSLDPWFMGVTLRYGPDGGVFVSDWSDTGECHSRRNTRRHTGRIYKITFGESAARQVDVSTATDSQLVQWQTHANDWFVRHARRVLQERQAAGKSMDLVCRQLRELFQKQEAIPKKLRALWALHVLGGANAEFLTQQLQHESPHVRAWSIRLLCENRSPGKLALERFREIAAQGDSPYVRLYLTSALMRLDAEAKWMVLPALLARAEDNGDANLPNMYWYATQPLVDDSIEQFVDLLKTTRIAQVQRHIARRVASDPGFAGQLNRIVGWLVTNDDERATAEVLAGLLAGLEGQREVHMPRNWPAAFDLFSKHGNNVVQEKAVHLALAFNDPNAVRKLRAAVADSGGDTAHRQVALNALVGRRVPGLTPLLVEMLDDASIQRTAIRGLASYDDGSTPKSILARYDTMPIAARQDALQTLASRRVWANELLDAVAQGSIPRADLSTYTARQLRNLGDPRILAKVNEIWGEVRLTSDEQKRRIDETKKRLSPATVRQANIKSGLANFEKNCANCHTIFGKGGKIGPDLTGAQRTNLDYLLENMIDPSAAVSRDYQMEIITTDAGRVVTGLVVAETGISITVQAINDRLVLPKEEIDDRQKSKLSMMPTGLLDKMSPEEIRDLIGFLSQ
jgi:putative membrane-bound dehydrogenase-like protein